MSKAEEGKTVKVHYTGKLKNGEVFDTSENREPIEFEIGKEQMISGFEEAVVGMEVGESKTVDLDKSEAYGEINDDLFIEVPKDQLPEDIEPEVGMQMSAQSQSGQQIPVKIKEVKDATIVVDANHPLAGRDLTFDIELVDIS